MINREDDLDTDINRAGKGKPAYTDLGIGILMATTFYLVGIILGKLINPFLVSLFGVSIHSYALMIITVGVVKVSGIMPDKYELAAEHWYHFVAKNFTSALLVGIGIAYIDLPALISAFSLSYIVLVVVTVIGAIIGAGVVGKLLGLYPIETAITAGLCMANMGGTGDVAVLEASDRMELMPFAQISSRIGGAFIIILASILIGVIG